MRRIGVVILIVLAIFLFQGVFRQTYGALTANDRLESAAQEYSRLQDENRRLKKQLEVVESDEFIEQQGRDKLNYARPGETIVIMPQAEFNAIVEPPQPIQPISLPKWRRWLQLLQL